MLGLAIVPRRTVVLCGAALFLVAAAARAQEVRCPPASGAGGAAARERDSCLAAQEGVEAFRRAQYEVAVRKFEESLWMSVQFEPGLKEYWLGRSLLGVGKMEEAAFAFYRALRAEERRPGRDTVLIGSTRLWLGKTYDLLGRRGAAERWYTEVVDSAAARRDKEEARRYLGAPFREDPVPAPPGVRELRAVLRDVVAAETRYRSTQGGYTDELEVLGVTVPKGIGVQFFLLDAGAGYIAEARWTGRQGVCRVAQGRGVRADDRGVIRCE